MSAAEKENIYVELRNYHLEQFPKKLATSNMDALLASFRTLEDKIISMLVSFVNGKAEFVDFSGELNAFSRSVKIVPTGDRTEDLDRNLFTAKIAQLSKMLSLAEMATFKLKIPRVPKTVFGQARMKTKLN